jgi:hypothetical protein
LRAASSSRCLQIFLFRQTQKSRLGVVLTDTALDIKPPVQGLTLLGDYGLLIQTTGGPRTRTNTAGQPVVVVEERAPRYKVDANGNLTAANGPIVVDNALFGGSQADFVDGLSGDDFLLGYVDKTFESCFVLGKICSIDLGGSSALAN